MYLPLGESSEKLDFGRTRGGWCSAPETNTHWKKPGGDRATGEQIRVCVQFFGSDLLRRHVSDGAERRAGASQVLYVDRG